MTAGVEAFLARLDPRLLYELGHLAELAAHRGRWAPVVDPERTATELADMLAGGDRPGLGWWRPRVTRATPGPIRSSAATVAQVVVELTVDMPGIDWSVHVVKAAVDAGADRDTAEMGARDGVKVVDALAAGDYLAAAVHGLYGVAA